MHESKLTTASVFHEEVQTFTAIKACRERESMYYTVPFLLKFAVYVLRGTFWVEDHMKTLRKIIIKTTIIMLPALTFSYLSDFNWK